MTTVYKPIACALHDEYEIAIMHKKQLNIKWIDEAEQEHNANVRPTDILVKDKQEFLIARTQDGEVLCIRLDKIFLLDS